MNLLELILHHMEKKAQRSGRRQARQLYATADEKMLKGAEDELLKTLGKIVDIATIDYDPGIDGERSVSVKIDRKHRCVTQINGFAIDGDELKNNIVSMQEKLEEMNESDEDIPKETLSFEEIFYGKSSESEKPMFSSNPVFEALGKVKPECDYLRIESAVGGKRCSKAYESMVFDPPFETKKCPQSEKSFTVIFTPIVNFLFAKDFARKAIAEYLAEFTERTGIPAALVK